MTSPTWVSRRRPSAPPGCERAKSSAAKPRASSRATASASPSASAAVVLAVGARFSGQASSATAASRWASAWRASGESDLPVIAIRRAPWRLTSGTIISSSSLEPEFDSASTTSSGVIMPRSPWAASAACTKYAGVPVLASVAAILRAMWPDLPMPVTMTRPWRLRMMSTARSNSSPTRSASAATAAASMRSTRRARATARLSAEVEIGSMESMLYTGRKAVAARPVAGCRCDACCVRPIAGLYNKHPGRRPARL